MPLSVELSFLCSEYTICSVPVFFLVLLAVKQCETPESVNILDTLRFFPDKIAESKAPESPEYYIMFLQRTIPWQTLAPYLLCPSYMQESIGNLWTSHTLRNGLLSIRLHRVSIPDTLYRYMKFDPDRNNELLSDGRMFMPCPAKFNDPFDCSLDKSIRLSFIESAIGCFSTVSNNVLMFSHYADKHSGLCIGFDTRGLIRSLSNNNKPLSADLRPVWYFSKMPPLSLDTEPALCATCKYDIWSYESEFRIFMKSGPSLIPSRSFYFDRNSILEVIYGCKAEERTITICKSLTNDLPFCNHKIALQVENEFGIQLQDINRM